MQEPSRKENPLSTPWIIQKYILRECLLFFLLALLIFTGLLLTLKILKLASLVIHKGVQFIEVLKVIVAIVPTFFEIAIPLATLVGCMLALSRFSGDSEIVVMRASGISFYRILMAPLLTGLLLCIVSVYVSTQLKPWGHNLLSNTLLDIARSKSTAALESGLFQKIGDITFYCKDLDQVTGDAEDVLVDDRRDPSVRKIITALSGEITTNPQTRDISLKLYDGEIHEIVGTKYVVTRFESNSVILQSGEMFSDDASSRGRSPRELSMEELQLSIDELNQLINSQKTKGWTLSEIPEILKPQLMNQPLERNTFLKRLTRVLEEYNIRFSIPLSTLLLALIGGVFGIQPARAQKSLGVTVSIFSAIVVFVIYYALLSSGITLAEKQTLPAFLAVWIPNIFLAAVIATLTYLLGKERWNSAAEGILDLIGNRFIRR